MVSNDFFFSRLIRTVVIIKCCACGPINPYLLLYLSFFLHVDVNIALIFTDLGTKNFFKIFRSDWIQF